MNEDQAVSALSALAHTQRLRLFRALVVAGPEGLTPSVIADQLGLARNALSFHLKELLGAGLLNVEQQGRNLIYRAHFGQMTDLLGYLTEHCCQGGVCEVTNAFPDHNYPGANCPSPCNEERIMSTTPYNVLFICTGNSARSILAEGLLNGLGQGRFRAYSAGSMPKGEVHPLALKTLASLKLPAEGYRSKSWDEFAGADAPHMDFIFTVCDNAAGEVCPVWPGHPMSAHWGVPDPAAAEGTEEQRLRAFQDTARVLKRRIELFTSLPLNKLDAMALHGELKTIGQAQE